MNAIENLGRESKNNWDLMPYAAVIKTITPRLWETLTAVRANSRGTKLISTHQKTVLNRLVLWVSAGFLFKLYRNSALCSKFVTKHKSGAKPPSCYTLTTLLNKNFYACNTSLSHQFLRGSCNRDAVRR